MFNKTKNILRDAAGKLYDSLGKHKKLLVGLGGGVAASPLLYDHAVELGRRVYSLGRRATNVSDMIENTDPNSPEAKHRRRVIANAQQRIANAQLANAQQQLQQQKQQI